MNNKKVFGKINFFDFIIIFIVVVVIIAGLLIYYSGDKKVVNKGTKITYVMELIDNPVGFSELISLGDDIDDSIKNYSIGKIKGIEKTINTKISNDLVNNRIVESEVPNKERVLLTVETDIVDNGIDLIAGGGYDIRVGKYVEVRGKGYAGTGFILEVGRD